MSEKKYPLQCLTTGRILAEGNETQLREYFNAVGLGEPFDQEGNVNYPEPMVNQLYAPISKNR